MRKMGIITVCSAALALGAGLQVSAQAGRQGAPAGPPSLTGEVRAQFTSVSNNIVRSAEQFPEDKYHWTPPVPAQPDNATIRTWAQLVAHMTDDANNNCWSMAGLSAAPASVERGTPGPNEKSKADLVAAVTSAMETCTKAFDNLNESNMMEPAGGRGNASKIGRLITYVAHANEHYGNMVTYMRMAGMVPPSSAGRGRGGRGGRGRM